MRSRECSWFLVIGTWSLVSGVACGLDGLDLFFLAPRQPCKDVCSRGYGVIFGRRGDFTFVCLYWGVKGVATA